MVRIGDWIREAWLLVREDFWVHALVTLIFTATTYMNIAMLLIGPLIVGYDFMILQKLRNRDKPLNLNGLAVGFDQFMDSFLALLLSYVFMNLGMVACFVGVIVVHALLIFAFPLIADRGMGFWDAICLSYDRARHRWFGLSVFLLVLGLLTALVTMLTCGLGYFVMFPVAQVAYVLAYRDNFQMAPAGQQAAS